MGCAGLDWIHLAQDKNQWRTLVNMVMGRGAPYNVGHVLNSWGMIRL